MALVSVTRAETRWARLSPINMPMLACLGVKALRVPAVEWPDGPVYTAFWLIRMGRQSSAYSVRAETLFGRCLDWCMTRFEWKTWTLTVKIMRPTAYVTLWVPPSQ
jgi:hypothetical protein